MLILTLTGTVTGMVTGDYETAHCARITVKHDKGSSSLNVPIEFVHAFGLGRSVTINVEDCR